MVLSQKLHEAFKGTVERMTGSRTVSAFKEKGVLSVSEFVLAGDNLVSKCPTWSWESGEPSKRKSYLPVEKQYLITRNDKLSIRSHHLNLMWVINTVEILYTLSKSIIFTNGTEESRIASMSKEREQTKSRSSIVTTQIQHLGMFYPAESEHQKFELKRHPLLLQLIGNLPEEDLVNSSLAAN